MVLEAAAVQRADGTLRPEDLKNRDVREAVLTRLNAAGLSELDAPELHAQLNRHTAIEEIDADYLSDDTYVAYADTYLLDGTGRVVWAQASINGDMIEVLDNPDLEQLSDSIDGDRWAQGLLVVSGRGGLTLDYGLDQVGAGLPLDRAIEIISSELERGVSVSYAVSATDFTHDSWPKWEF